MFFKIAIYSSALAMTACASCTSCLTSDVSRMYKQDRRLSLGLKDDVIGIFEAEFDASRGLKKDLSRGFAYESYDPRDYLQTLNELFCPCP
jgi:hypothetical protein